MQYGQYIGETHIITYGCVLCQKYHRKGFDPEFEEHIYHQSKHGVSRRAPIGAAEIFVATIQAEEREENRKKGIVEPY